MAKFYAEQENQLKISDGHLQPGLHVAVKWKSEWHRGKIVKLEKSRRARVFFIDSAVTGDVSIDEGVCYLRSDFALLPAIAHRGILSYIKPKEESWNKDSINFMKKRYGQQFQAKIHRTEETSHVYFLSIKKADEQRQFLDSLIQLGACFLDTSFGEQNELVNVEDFVYYEEGRHLDAIDDDDWLPKTPKPYSNGDARSQIRGLEKLAKTAPKSDSTPMAVQPAHKTGQPPPKPVHPAQKTVEQAPKASPQRNFVMPEKRTRLEMPPKASIKSRNRPLKVPQVKEFVPAVSPWNEPNSCMMPAAQTSQPQIKEPQPAASTVSSWNEPSSDRKAARAPTTPEGKEPLKSSVINNRLQQNSLTQVPLAAAVASTSTAPAEPKSSTQVVEQPSLKAPNEQPASKSGNQTEPGRCPPTTRALGAQDLTKLEIGSKAEIIVNVVNDRKDFYFFFKEEFLNIQEFIDRFK